MLAREGARDHFDPLAEHRIEFRQRWHGRTVMRPYDQHRLSTRQGIVASLLHPLEQSLGVLTGGGRDLRILDMITAA